MLKDKKGVSNVITLAILVPVLLVLVFGIVMGSQISNVRSVTEEASRAGARWLSEHPGDITGAKQKAAQVIEESFTVPEGISDPDLKDKLVGKLTYVNNRFYINGQYVKPANSSVQQTLSSLVNSYVAAGGSYINPQTFQATVATTDPPETQSWTQTNPTQQNNTSNTTQTVGPTSHSGTYPAYYITKYGGLWNNWTSGWPDSSAWWIWGGTQSYTTHAISGQKVKLISPPFYTEAYAKYTVSGVCDDYFSAYIDSTNIFNGNGGTVQQWQWIRPGAGYHQAWMTGGNYYGPAGFLFSIQKTGYTFNMDDYLKDPYYNREMYGYWSDGYMFPSFSVSTPQQVTVKCSYDNNFIVATFDNYGGAVISSSINQHTLNGTFIGHGYYKFTALPGIQYWIEEINTMYPVSVDITFSIPETLINTGTPNWTYQPVNGIGYGSIALPITAAPNSSFNVTVPVTNLTNATWHMNDNGYGATYLSYHWYDINGNKVMDGDISRLSNDLPPNGSCNIPMTIKTPSTSGKYRLVIDGEQQDTAWFGTINNVNWNTIEAWITIGSTYGVQYNSVDVPKYMEKGKTYNISVTVKNTGSIPWTSGTFGMAYHWYSNNTCVLWDGTRDYVKTTVQPGQSYTFNVPVKALSNAGSYTLQFDMVQEGVTWFQKNCPVVNATVQIPDGDVLKGTLTYDGDYWINDTLVQQGQCDLSRLIGQNVILWGENTGQTEIYIVTDVSKYNPNQDTISTFDPILDVYCNDTVSPDPDHPDDTTVNFKRTDGYAYCRVVYHYPTPLRNFWNVSAKRNMFYSSQPLFINIGGESFFKENTQ
ncbi:TadE/TadG family type IV pilus assembly protein [Thermoanaerobacterium thermosaccharolyticum]|uniref:TadE/TadG family type IV pilus assembly protein n=1 Tax=Thermoanaerobacterium thermosaccharolyticum TaxID=1517 RepID=UPI002FD8AC8F